MSASLVNGFEKVSIDISKNIKLANKCEKVPQSSTRWELWYGTPEMILLPPPLMEDLVSRMLLNEVPRQAILLFESSGEAYVVVCQFNLLPEILKITALKGSEAAFVMVSQLVSRE